MEDHIMDSERAEMLEKKERYRILSREEILGEIEKDETVADIGSGTGFFTDDMAETAGKVYGVDFQEGMHQYYRKKRPAGKRRVNKLEGLRDRTRRP